MSSRITVQNEEHITAFQNDVNHSLNSLQDSLSDANKKRFDAISQCFKILKENDVSAFIFPVLMTLDGEYGCYQYNNALDFIKYDSSGKMSEDSLKKLSIFNAFFARSSTSFMAELIFKGREFNWDEFTGGIYGINKFAEQNRENEFYE